MWKTSFSLFFFANNGFLPEQWISVAHPELPRTCWLLSINPLLACSFSLGEQTFLSRLTVALLEVPSLGYYFTT